MNIKCQQTLNQMFLATTFMVAQLTTFKAAS